MNKRLIDLSHTITHQTLTYKGLPAPVICDYWSREDSKVHYEAGTSFQIGKIEMVANTGTYLDPPFHRYENGRDLSEVCLDQLVDLPAVLLHFSSTEYPSISAAHLQWLHIQAGRVGVFAIVLKFKLLQ